VGLGDPFCQRSAWWASRRLGTAPGSTIGEYGCTVYASARMIFPMMRQVWIPWHLNKALVDDDSGNSKMTIGLTIKQGANDDEILALKSSDCSHGITDYAEADTLGHLLKRHGSNAWLTARGFADGGVPLSLQGFANSAYTTKSTSAYGCIEINAAKCSGTGISSLGANANPVVIRNGATTRFISDAEGSAHADVEWTTFAEHDDLALLDVIEETVLAHQDSIRREFGAWLEENRVLLERLGLVHFDREREGHAMVNTTRMMMLLVGALRQVGRRLDDMSGGLN